MEGVEGVGEKIHHNVQYTGDMSDAMEIELHNQSNHHGHHFFTYKQLTCINTCISTCGSNTRHDIAYYQLPLYSTTVQYHFPVYLFITWVRSVYTS